MAKKVTNVPKSESVKEFLKCFDKLRYRHNALNVFSDFLTLSAISISNAVNFDEEREKEYLRTVKKYNNEECELFPQMLACIINEMQPAKGTTPRYYDVLGEIFNGLQLSDEWRGQFFTPQNVSDMMALMQVDVFEELIKKHGYIYAGEPCVGGGSMVIGLINAMIQTGYDPSKQLLVTAFDIDIRCVHMAYIQLSLAGVPAMIQQRNSLSGEIYSDYWYTPVFALEGWAEKLRDRGALDAVKIAPPQNDKENPKGTADNSLQLSLF